MAKEDIFSKWKLKDYSKELEKILDEKDFSAEVKNLLLSMFYKIEAGYQDYKMVKRDVISKKELMEQLMEKIQQDPYQLEIKKPQQRQKLEGKDKIQFKLKENTRKIEIFPNEQSIFNAIDRIFENEIEIQSQYGTVRKALVHFLICGHSMNHIEIIRDFDGWNWSVNADEIEEPYANILYQNLRILLGNSFLEDFVSNEQYVIDYVELLEQKLTKLCGEEYSKDYLTLFFQFILLLEFKMDKKEEQKWIELQEKLEEEREKLKNKARYLEWLSKTKKEKMKQLQKIDKIKADKNLLEQEFIKRNETADELTKIFSLQHLTRILKNERQSLLEEIAKISKQMDPKQLREKENKLVKDLVFIQGLNLNKKKQELLELLLLLQNKWMICFEAKIKRCETKKEIVESIYEFRYWNLLPLQQKQMLKEKEQVKKQKEKIEIVLLQKTEQLKMINPIFSKQALNVEVIDGLLELRAIELEAVQIKICEKEKSFEVSYYDGETIERTKQIVKQKDSKILVKEKKKIKLWL